MTGRFRILDPNPQYVWHGADRKDARCCSIRNDTCCSDCPFYAKSENFHVYMTVVMPGRQANTSHSV